MASRLRLRSIGLLPRSVLAALALVAASSTQAQYKVIGSDGKVTYTDREPSASEGRIVPLGSRAGASAPDADSAGSDLPYELRQVSNKYPVTLYVSSGACEPCVSGRQLLRQRGVPYSERIVVSAEDVEALQRLSGAQDAPTLAIGAQILRGLSADVWNSYLDAAGYPRTSRLPASYQYRAATPLVDQQPPTTGARADARTSAPAAPTLPQAPAPAGPGGFRF
jgi:glutaredoxin